MKSKIILDPDNTFFSSDLHLGHRTILNLYKGKSRPDVLSTEEMDDYIVDKINESVPSDGVLIHVGGLSFRKMKDTLTILDRIKCNISNIGHISLIK
jgi:calcineurin-like phosphoesterase family protein